MSGATTSSLKPFIITSLAKARYSATFLREK